MRLSSSSDLVDQGTNVGLPYSGAAPDLGAFEFPTLLECGDGGADPGEQCGEPGLSCADPCAACRGCICWPDAVCGDGLVCGAEECEQDTQCGGGSVCQGCRCVNASTCTSGNPLERVSLSLAATPYSLKLKGQAVVPKPWSNVDPLVNGVQVVVDGIAGPGGVILAVPGGAGWTVNGSATMWRYEDGAGTTLIVQDKSSQSAGLLRVSASTRGTSVVLPNVDGVRTSVRLGTAGECAAITWNGPAGAKPRCQGNATKLRCR